MLAAAQAEREALQPRLELTEECNASDVSVQPSTVVANEPAPLLTSGVNLITSELTTRLLNDQFEAAKACKEDLDRSTEKDPFGVNFSEVCDGHSLRHSFNQFPKNQKDVKKVRLDILGHAGEDLNEEIYGDEEGMPFEMKKAAIDQQPRLF